MTATVLNINNKGRFMLKHAPVPSRPLTPTTAPTLPPKAGAVQGRLPDVGSLPDQDEKKTEVLGVRLDAQDAQDLQDDAARTGVSESEWTRSLIRQRLAMLKAGSRLHSSRSDPLLAAARDLCAEIERSLADHHMSRTERARATALIADVMDLMWPSTRRKRA